MQFGVFIPGHWMNHGKSAKHLYDEMLAEAVFADELGFDNIWLAEHYAIDYIAIPDPLQLATTIFERTDTIKAGVAVLILRNHHPIKLAAEISQIDVMYGGRFEAALGRGASGYELRQMQLEMEESASRRLYNEHLEVMTALWKSRKSIAYQGEFFEFDNTAIVPPPYSPEPPFHLAGVSTDSVRQQAQRCHDLGIPIQVMTTALREDFDYVRERYCAFTDTVDRVGAPRKQSKFSVNRVAYLTETDEQAWAIMPTLTKLHRGLVHMLSDTETMIDGVLHYPPVPQELAPQEMYDNCLIGSPDTVREKVRAYYDLGVDHLIAYVHLGQPHDEVMRSMALFAKEVMPEFHHN